MLLHQKVIHFNAYLTYMRLKVLFSAQKNKTNEHESMQNCTWSRSRCNDAGCVVST